MNQVQEAKPFRAIARPPGSLILGNLAEFRDDILTMLLKAQQEYGDVVRFRFAHQPGALFSEPEDIAHLLIKNHRNYRKKTRGYAAMSALIGNGLVTSEGDFWLRQRRIAQPSFHKKRIAGFATSMAAAAERMAKDWAPRAKNQEAFDVADEMMKLTLQIVGETLLSADVSSNASEVSGALDIALHYVLDRIRFPFMLPQGFPTARNRELKRAIAILNQIVMRIIAERRAAPEGAEAPADLLTMLMEARDEESGEGMTDVQLRDEVMTMFLAGHETTANALSWTWHLLGQNPDCEARLHAELDEVLAGRTPTFEDLPKLVYTRMVIDESMRLYPPVPLVARMSHEADVISGYQIPPNLFIFICPYVTHRHPKYWPDAERFDPERFDPQNPIERPRFAYFPFLGGPRQCIGNTFAIMEAQLCLATIASRYRLRPVAGHPVEPELTITQRPRYGLKMTIEPRS
ncbi:MAG: cytochrome P450 [Bradymonadaceae bacterium]|nr:cytochrome P450 [Lujinxingiaceae bacterium]